MSLKQFSNILVPIDGSDNADRAFEKARAIAEKFDSKLILIHVIGDFILDFSTTPEGMQIPDTTVVKIRDSMREQAETMMKERLELAKKHKLACESVILVGDVSSEIIQYVHKNKIDLVVIGARGMGKFKQLLLGSVSNRVAANSICPVMIVK